MKKSRICVVNASWPRLSTTFIAQEFVGLEQLGLQLLLATYSRSDPVTQKIHRQLKAPVTRLPMKPRQSLRFVKAWLKFARRPGYKRARALLSEHRRREAGRRPLRSFGRGLILASEMPDDVGIVYSHFIDAPTDVAMYAATIRGLPLATSAHARDIWLTEPEDLRTKLGVMRWCATCTAPGADYLRTLADDPAKVHVIYHGLDFDRFPETPAEHGKADGSDPAKPVRLLSVGRAVEKKGFDVLLDALAALPAELSWHWHHIGIGLIHDELKARASALGIDDRIEWHGAQVQDFVIARYRDCDLFVLPSREAGDGDRDGLPNVLMEAQSQGLACLSTNFSAIPELIVDGETGVLVPPGDTKALAAALEALIRSPEERERLGMAGYRRVRSEFHSETGIRKLAALLTETMDKADRA